MGSIAAAFIVPSIMPVIVPVCNSIKSMTYDSIRPIIGHLLPDLLPVLAPVQIRPEVRHSIGELVRSMNCYYSNLIEGHDTHPRDIDRAMDNKYSADPRKREFNTVIWTYCGLTVNLGMSTPGENCSLMAPENCTLL